MSTFVCGKTRTVLGLQSTDGGDGYTCLFEDLGLRQTRMKKREDERGLSSRNLLHEGDKWVVDLNQCSIDALYIARDGGHMILLNSIQQLTKSGDHSNFLI